MYSFNQEETSVLILENATVLPTCDTIKKLLCHQETKNGYMNRIILNIFKQYEDILLKNTIQEDITIKRIYSVSTLLHRWLIDTFYTDGLRIKIPGLKIDQNISLFSSSDKSVKSVKQMVSKNILIHKERFDHSLEQLFNGCSVHKMVSPNKLVIHCKKFAKFVADNWESDGFFMFKLEGKTHVFKGYTDYETTESASPVERENIWNHYQSKNTSFIDPSTSTFKYLMRIEAFNVIYTSIEEIFPFFKIVIIHMLRQRLSTRIVSYFGYHDDLETEQARVSDTIIRTVVVKLTPGLSRMHVLGNPFPYEYDREIGGVSWFLSDLYHASVYTHNEDTLKLVFFLALKDD